MLAAKELGADRIIAMSRHEPRQQLARIKDLTGGIGADAVLECVGTAEAMSQARRSTRPGGGVGVVGVPHGVSIDGQELFFSHVRVQGGPAPVPA